MEREKQAQSTEITELKKKLADSIAESDRQKSFYEQALEKRFN